MISKPVAIPAVKNTRMPDHLRSIGEMPSNVSSFYRTIALGEIPESVPSELHNRYMGPDRLVSSLATNIIHELFYFATATKYFASALKKEIGAKAVLLDPLAGKGYLAKSLQEVGLDCIATDDNSNGFSKHIENLDALDALSKYGSKINYLIISWAHFNSDIDYKLLMKVRNEFPHVTIINIGEGQGGTTNSIKFWDAAKPVMKNATNAVNKSYVALPGLHDYVIFLK